MKTIEPIQIWIKGKTLTATVFNLYPIGGELHLSAHFYYQLLDENLGFITEGNLSLLGEDYQKWNENDDYPFEWAAISLNLIITGNKFIAHSV